jgi:hypothetical protein
MSDLVKLPGLCEVGLRPWFEARPVLHVFLARLVGQAPSIRSPRASAGGAYLGCVDCPFSEPRYGRGVVTIVRYLSGVMTGRNAGLARKMTGAIRYGESVSHRGSACRITSQAASLSPVAMRP